VLPSGELNGIIPEPLLDYFESFTIVIIVQQWCMETNSTSPAVAGATTWLLDIILFSLYSKIVLHSRPVAVEVSVKINLKWSEAPQTSPRAQCMVLPPGEFNGVITETLPIHSENLTSIAV